MRIPLADVSFQHRIVRDRLDATIGALLEDPACDTGLHVRGLESQLSQRLGGLSVVGVQSGTAGLFLALKALGIGPGDEVITVPNSDLPTTAAVSHTGARFVLGDVEPDTFNLDPAGIGALITPRTRALLPVHLYGHPADMDPLMAIARRHNLYVVEDAALALGATYRGQPCGTIGNIGVFSFSPRKVLGGTGSGGAVATRDAKLERRLRLLRGYGEDPAKTEAPLRERLQQAGASHEVEGFNLRLDGLQAAIIGLKLDHLEEWAALRREVAARYDELFRGSPVVAPAVRAGCEHAYRDYVVQLPHRDHVRRRLSEREIETDLRYVPPVHLQPVYRHLNYGMGGCPVAEAQAQRLLCLPIYPGMPAEFVDEVADGVLSALRSE